MQQTRQQCTYRFLFLISSLRIHLFLQGEGVLEVQQPVPQSGAGLPALHPQGLHGLRADAHRPRPAAGRRRQLGRGDRAGQRGEHGEGHRHRHPLRAGTVPAGVDLHCGAVQEEGYATPHTVLQTLHAGMGLKHRKEARRWGGTRHRGEQDGGPHFHRGGQWALDNFHENTQPRLLLLGHLISSIRPLKQKVTPGLKMTPLAPSLFNKQGSRGTICGGSLK